MAKKNKPNEFEKEICEHWKSDNTDAYYPNKNSSDDYWAWEFLRRNKNYQKEFKEIDDESNNRKSGDKDLELAISLFMTNYGIDEKYSDNEYLKPSKKYLENKIVFFKRSAIREIMPRIKHLMKNTETEVSELYSDLKGNRLYDHELCLAVNLSYCGFDDNDQRGIDIVLDEIRTRICAYVKKASNRWIIFKLKKEKKSVQNRSVWQDYLRVHDGRILGYTQYDVINTVYKKKDSKILSAQTLSQRTNDAENKVKKYIDNPMCVFQIVSEKSNTSKNLYPLGDIYPNQPLT